MPYFSVLIANYNNGDYIDTAINSVLSQSFTDWEIIVVDDCSTDDSIQVLSKYENNPKIRINKNNSNYGTGYTKNRCIQLSNGVLAGFLDSDDALNSDALMIMVGAFNNAPNSSLIYSTHYICDASLNILEIANYVGILKRNDFLLSQPGDKLISHFSVFKTESYLKSDGISPEMKKAVDHDLYFLLEEQGEVNYVNIPLYLYRHHSNNISIGGKNEYLAMIWDYEARRRAFKRRINNNHHLYLANKKLYNERNLYSTIISTQILKKENRFISILKAYNNYFNRTRLIDLSFYRIFGALFPIRLKNSVFSFLNHFGLMFKQ